MVTCKFNCWGNILVSEGMEEGNVFRKIVGAGQVIAINQKKECEYAIRVCHYLFFRLSSRNGLG